MNAQKMDSMLREIEGELPRMQWMTEVKEVVEHFTGSGPRWTLQLMVTAEHRMAAASSAAAMTVMKLTDELAAKAEKAARAWFAGKERDAWDKEKH